MTNWSKAKQDMIEDIKRIARQKPGARLGEVIAECCLKYGFSKAVVQEAISLMGILRQISIIDDCLMPSSREAEKEADNALKFEPISEK